MLSLARCVLQCCGMRLASRDRVHRTTVAAMRDVAAKRVSPHDCTMTTRAIAVLGRSRASGTSPAL
jgi:hypothetical protein